MQPWQLDDQVLQADDCGRSVSFRAALGFPHLLFVKPVLMFSDRQANKIKFQAWFPIVWSSSVSTVPRALQLSHNEIFPPT